jgi:hypothetical protein
MNEQTTFVEPLKVSKRTRSTPEKIAARINPLADWYKANKPAVKSIRITADDAYSLRQCLKEGKTVQLYGAGFREEAGGV